MGTNPEMLSRPERKSSFFFLKVQAFLLQKHPINWEIPSSCEYVAHESNDLSVIALSKTIFWTASWHKTAVKYLVKWTFFSTVLTAGLFAYKRQQSLHPCSYLQTQYLVSICDQCKSQPWLESLGLFRDCSLWIHFSVLLNVRDGKTCVIQWQKYPFGSNWRFWISLDKRLQNFGRNKEIPHGNFRLYQFRFTKHNKTYHTKFISLNLPLSIQKFRQNAWQPTEP